MYLPSKLPTEEAQRSSHILVASVMMMSGVILSFYSYRWPLLYTSNQNTYYPHGLLLGGAQYLNHDWYSNTTPVHVVFSYLVSFLNKNHVVEPVSLSIEIFLFAVLLVSFWLIAYAFWAAAMDNERKRFDQSLSKAEFASIVLLSFSMVQFARIVVSSRLSNFSTVSEIVASLDISGLAEQYIFAGYLQPSEFGILIVLGIALAYCRQYWAASFFIGVASIFHVSYIPHAGLVILILCGWLWSDNQRQQALLVGLTFALFLLPITVYSVFLFSDESSMVRVEANHILAHERIPHHAIPSIWWDIKATIKILIMILASLILAVRSSGLLAWIVTVGTGVTIFGTAFVWMTGNSEAGLLFPWRGSTFLFPISLVVVLSYFIKYSVALLGALVHNPRFIIRWGQLALVAIALGGAFMLQQRSLFFSPYPTSIREFAEITREATTSTDVIIIPPDLDSFRLIAQRPVFVDFKSHPYRPSEFLVWWQRIQFVRNFYMLDNDARNQACQNSGAKYYVIRIEDNPIVFDDASVGNQDYALIACKD